MDLTPEEFRRVVKAARLELSPEEEERYREDCKAILKSFAKISEVDTSGINASPHPIAVEKSLGKDEAHPSGLDPFTSVKNKKDGFFKGPKIL